MRYWRPVLGLRDWTVKATLSRHYDLSESDREGECEVNEEHRFVRIWLLHPTDYAPDAIFEQDHERTLVHELLHVHYEAVKPDEDDARGLVAIEQSINAIAEGLVKLRRE